MKRFIIYIILFSLLATFISPTITRSGDNASSSQAILDDLQRGFWLNRAYLTRLIETKSPRKASVNIYETGFWVKKKNNKYPALVLFNSNEAGASFTITDLIKSNTNDVYDLITTPEPYANIKQQRVTLTKKKNGDEIQWSFRSNDMKSYNLLFVRVEPDLDQYINETLLAGEYKDESNRTFIFTKESTAIWPERTFKYKIHSNFALIADPESNDVCDSINNIEKQGWNKSITEWQFSIQSDMLIIYKPKRTVIYKKKVQPSPDNRVLCGNNILYTLRRSK